MLNAERHTIHFHGGLKKYGKTFSICCKTIRGGIHLLANQIEGLKQSIMDGHFTIVKGDLESGLVIPNSIDSTGRNEYLDMYLGEEHQHIHLIPRLQGAGGDNSAFTMIAGAIIMVAAVVMSPYTGGASFSAAMSTSSSFFGITYGSMFLMGASLMLSGLSSLLAPAPSTSLGSEGAAENASYFLSSPRNLASQGGAIPIAFGRTWCGSYAISAGLEVYAV